MQRSHQLVGTLIGLGCMLQTQGAMAAGSATIGLLVANLQNDIFAQIVRSVEATASDAGADVIVLDANDDGPTQLQQAQDLAARKVQAIIAIPTGPAADAAPIKVARTAAIPVVTVDRNPIGAPGDAFIGTDNVAAAKVLGDYACKVTAGKADLDIIESPLHTRHEDERNKGFSAAMEACPGLTEVDRDWTHTSSPQEGFTYAQRALTQDAGISIIFGRVDTLALGAARAVEAAHPDHKIFVLGFDGDLAALNAVRDGRLDATMTQKTTLMGKLALRSALDLVAGKKVAAEQTLDAVLTTRDNVDRIIADHP